MIDVLQTRLLEQAISWLDISQHRAADATTRAVAQTMFRSCIEMLAETLQMRLVSSDDD